MTVARAVARALLGSLITISAGCQTGRSVHASASPARTLVYSAVLRDVRTDSAARMVVVDSLLPATDIEADQHQLVLSGLSITRRMLDAFLRLQRAPHDRFQVTMLPDPQWSVVSMSQLDSLRVGARASVAHGLAPRGVRNDQFWQQWYRTYPASRGYVVLSPASLSPDGETAIVQVSIACGPLCGESELRLMRRDADGAWRTSGRVRLSES